ncbi:MAG: beta-L-arabinofuranosidase domain-containing protein, partial [Vicinamibacterales bacterium]
DQRASDRAWPASRLAFIDRHHGQANGIFAADECLSGRNPMQGTELCTVVEFMYSLETLFSVLGDPAFADRLEKVAFNALPAALAPNVWSHQYDQQVNQAQCTINPDHRWSTNGPESNLFGLEPNYGCCTANLHQGWPKFLSHLWMKTPDEGIAAAAYAPSRATFESRGVPVSLSMETDYPFRETLSLIVEPARAARFPVVLRVPAWATGATARVGSGPATPLAPGSLHRIEREWRGRVEIAIRFPMTPGVIERYNGAVAIERGPLLYALKLGESWTRVNADEPHRELPHGDFEVRPTTPWNYGLVTSGADSVKGLAFEERPVGDVPFSPDGAGTIASARARRIPSWRLDAGWAAEIAPGDARLADPGRERTSAPDETVTLVPYGCTNIRIAEFPRLT